MYGSPQLAKDIEIREVGAPVANASNTDNNSDRIDMANYEGAIFLVPVEDSAQTGVATAKIEQNTSDSDSGMAALAGATATATSASNDDLNGKLLVVSVHRPRERYIQLNRISATANIAFGTVTCILYGKRVLPVTAHSTILSAAHVVSPAEA